MTKTKQFETDLEKLNEIVNNLNSDTITLHEGLELLEEGISLVKKCNYQLEQGRGKLRTLLDEGGCVVTLDMAESDGDFDGF